MQAGNQLASIARITRGARSNRTDRDRRHLFFLRDRANKFAILLHAGNDSFDRIFLKDTRLGDTDAQVHDPTFANQFLLDPSLELAHEQTTRDRTDINSSIEHARCPLFSYER